MGFDGFGAVGWGEFGVAHDEGDADGGFVGGTFIDHAVFAVEEAVIAGEDEQSIVELAGLLEGVIDAADGVIDGEDGAPVGAGHVFEGGHAGGGGIGEVFAPIEEGAVDAVPGLEALVDPGGFIVQVEGGGGVGDADVVERVFVLGFREIEAMGGFVADHEQEGFGILLV